MLPPNRRVWLAEKLAHQPLAIGPHEAEIVPRHAAGQCCSALAELAGAKPAQQRAVGLDLLADHQPRLGARSLAALCQTGHPQGHDDRGFGAEPPPIRRHPDPSPHRATILDLPDKSTKARSMPAPAIKICGISEVAALDAAIGARADHAGFNFFPPSPRFLAPREAAALAVRAEGRIGRVGVFVDADDAAIAEAVAAAKLDALQLHGSESPERAAQIRARFGLPVWKAIPVATRDDVARAHSFAGAADFILFDAKTPNGAALTGGMGLAFDWSLVARWNGPLPWGLAGGLEPGNVAEAVRLTAAPLVDVSSGVERAPSVKDVDKIAAFAYAARQFSS
jgi:phosphoribosylanthranilate isomerase